MLSPFRHSAVFHCTSSSLFPQLLASIVLQFVVSGVELSLVTPQSSLSKGSLKGSTMVHSGATFSYAQAAKGESPSLSATARPPKDVSESAALAMNVTNTKKTGTTSSESVDTDPKMAGENQPSAPNESEKISTTDAKATNVAKMTSASTAISPSRQTQESQNIKTLSTPPSPSSGSASTSTLPKEDDVFATPNGSSDSTWEKNSQTSQNEEKGVQSPDAEKDDGRQSWDPPAMPSAILREAPPPAFNFWQKRAMDAQAKANKETKQVEVPNVKNERGQPNGPKKNEENAGLNGKPENKKKGKSVSQQTDAVPGHSPSKEATRPGDVREAAVGDGKFSILHSM